MTYDGEIREAHSGHTVEETFLEGEAGGSIASRLSGAASSAWCMREKKVRSKENRTWKRSAACRRGCLREAAGSV